MSDPPLSFDANREQQEAIDATGLVFVAAGAGTGKTRVLVERFARALLDRQIAPDRVLAITYTERAAAELVGRIRARLVDVGEHDLARGLDGAWVSTIHAFCGRVLRAYALQAGLDPAFVVLDGSGADLLRAEAYATALERAVERDEHLLDLVTAYGEDRLRGLIDGTHERLRTAGLPLRFSDPPVADLPERLADAVAEAAALAATLGPGVFLDESRTRASALVDVLATGPDAATIAELGPFRSRGKLDAAAAYDAALAALERSARDAVYAELRPQLDELLAAFAAEYAGRKRAASLLDFDDLQLETRQLLERRRDVRDALRERFAQVMVDEFQDTNELQCSIIDAVTREGGDLFFVGDEFQSIYRFRHADVSVFRRRRDGAAAAGDASAIALTTNYRSRPEVLAVVNHLFGDAFGDGYAPLQAGGTFPELAPGEPAVEFLVTRSEHARAAGLEPRAAEGQALAARLRTLVDAGACGAGEIVLLFSAGTDADVYEEALARVGLATASSTGRRYFEAQPVRDVVAYLRLVRNRYDDAALLAVLASPLVGVSNDTLALVRMAAPRRSLFSAIEHGIPATIDEADGRLLAAFRQRFDRLVEVAARADLALLVERIVAEHDYDLALLAHPSGARRTANVRKLARLAREFSELRGPDIEGFVTTVEVRRLTADREADALTMEEGAEAVRLMTIHAAKGLQFRVVVVADAGRAAGPRNEHLVALPDGRIGVKVPDAVGQLHETAAYREALAVDRGADDDERRRVSYVALTRAVDRLIVSGCIDERAAGRGATPLAWMLSRLGADIEALEQQIAVPGGSVAVRFWEAIPEPHTEAPVELKGQLAFFDDPREVDALPPPTIVAIPPPLAPLAAAPADRPARLSFSALHQFERCPFRFAAERLHGFRVSDERPRAASAAAGLTGAELGTVVHTALEHPGDDLLAEVVGAHPAAGAADLERARKLVDAWRGSPLAAEVEGLGPRREAPLLLRVGGAAIAGFIDVVARRPGGEAVVVDYKTNRLGERTAAQLFEEDYALQCTVYALALLEAGAPAVDVHFAFLDAGETVTRAYTRADQPALLETLGRAVAGALEGPYPPRPGPACEDCPVLGLLCAGPDLDALHAAPDAY